MAGRRRKRKGKGNTLVARKKRQVQNLGRGHLTKMDTLPPEANDIIEWANGELRERKRYQKDIYADFCRKLKEAGIETEISPMAFNRYSTRYAQSYRRMEAAAELVKTLGDRLELSNSVDLLNAVSQLGKTAVLEKLAAAADGELSPDELSKLGRAVKDFATTQRLSNALADEVRRQREKEIAAKIQEEMSKGGVRQDKIDIFKHDVLGLRR